VNKVAIALGSIVRPQSKSCKKRN